MDGMFHAIHFKIHPQILPTKRVDAKDALAALGALHVVQKNGNDRDFAAQKSRQQKLVEKDFVEPILSARFHGKAA